MPSRTLVIVSLLCETYSANVVTPLVRPTLEPAVEVGVPLAETAAVPPRDDREADAGCAGRREHERDHGDTETPPVDRARRPHDPVGLDQIGSVLRRDGCVAVCAPVVTGGRSTVAPEASFRSGGCCRSSAGSWSVLGPGDDRCDDRRAGSSVAWVPVVGRRARSPSPRTPPAQFGGASCARRVSMSFSVSSSG